jgi:hypothetical protein
MQSNSIDMQSLYPIRYQLTRLETTYHTGTVPAHDINEQLRQRAQSAAAAAIDRGHGALPLGVAT